MLFGFLKSSTFRLCLVVAAVVIVEAVMLNTHQQANAACDVYLRHYTDPDSPCATQKSVYCKPCGSGIVQADCDCKQIEFTGNVVIKTWRDVTPTMNPIKATRIYVDCYRKVDCKLSVVIHSRCGGGYGIRTCDPTDTHIGSMCTSCTYDPNAWTPFSQVESNYIEPCDIGSD